MKKKILSILMAVSISITLLACGGGNGNSVDTSSTKEDNSTVKVEDETTTDTKDLETLKANNQVVIAEGMTIYFPVEWEKKTLQGSDIYYVDNKGTNVNITTESAQGLNTEEYCELSFKNLKEDPSIQNFKSDTTTINNSDYIIDDYTMTNGTTTINIYQLCIIVDDIAYIITLGALPEAIEANKVIINNLAKDISFK